MMLMDIFLHLDDHLISLVSNYGMWVYGFLFLVIFCETGLIVMPFLPGDSLLFVAGTMAAGTASKAAGIDVHVLVFILVAAAILGDSVNYTIGRKMGYRLFAKPDSKIFRRDYLEYTQAFYARHGGKTVIIARFAPIIRTFAPFVAGVAQMHYTRFLLFNVIGAIIWITSFTYAGYFVGNIDWVKQYLNVMIIGIIIISLSPAVIAVVRRRGKKPLAS